MMAPMTLQLALAIVFPEGPPPLPLAAGAVQAGFRRQANADLEL